MTLTLLLAAVGSCAFAAMLLLAAPRRAWLRERIEPHVGPLPPEQEQPRRDPLATWFGAGLRSLDDSRLAGVLRRELERAGSARSPSQLASTSVAAAALVWGASAAAGVPGFAVLVLALAGAFLPHGLLRIAARRRARAFDAQLPDTLDMLAAALRVGHGFEQALRAVGEAAAAPTGPELARALGEIRLGRLPAEALGEVGERLSSADMPFVTAAVEIQHEVGGSLADLLAIVAATVRERQQFRRQVNAMTGMGRASAAALALLPFAAAGLLTAVSPEYMHPLWHTSTGRLLVAAALGMMLVGAAILKRIVSIRG